MTRPSFRLSALAIGVSALSACGGADSEVAALTDACASGNAELSRTECACMAGMAKSELSEAQFDFLVQMITADDPTSAAEAAANLSISDSMAVMQFAERAESECSE